MKGKCVWKLTLEERRRDGGQKMGKKVQEMDVHKMEVL